MKRAGYTGGKPPGNHGKRATPADVLVGELIKSRRLELGLSQTAIAEQLGVTFQQVQKYEKGVNRVGAGRLQRIAEVLEVQPAYFFPGSKGGIKSADMPMVSMLQNALAMRQARAFNKVKGRDVRRAIIILTEALAGIAGAQEETDD